MANKLARDDRQSVLQVGSYRTDNAVNLNGVASADITDQFAYDTVVRVKSHNGDNWITRFPNDNLVDTIVVAGASPSGFDGTYTLSGNEWINGDYTLRYDGDVKGWTISKDETAYEQIAFNNEFFISQNTEDDVTQPPIAGWAIYEDILHAVTVSGAGLDTADGVYLVYSDNEWKVSASGDYKLTNDGVDGWKLTNETYGGGYENSVSGDNPPLTGWTVQTGSLYEVSATGAGLDDANGAYVLDTTAFNTTRWVNGDYTLTNEATAGWKITNNVYDIGGYTSSVSGDYPALTGWVLEDNTLYEISVASLSGGDADNYVGTYSFNTPTNFRNGLQYDITNDGGSGWRLYDHFSGVGFTNSTSGDFPPSTGWTTLSGALSASGADGVVVSYDDPTATPTISYDDPTPAPTMSYFEVPTSAPTVSFTNTASANVGMLLEDGEEITVLMYQGEYLATAGGELNIVPVEK